MKQVFAGQLHRLLIVGQLLAQVLIVLVHSNVQAGYDQWVLLVHSMVQSAFC